MREANAQKSKTLVRVSGTDEKFQVEGFVDAYESFIDENPSCCPSSRLPDLLLTLLGAVIAVAGLLIMLFGPGKVMVSVASGPTLFQYIQIYPGYVFSLGAFLFSVGIRPSRDAKGISREKFFAAEYELVGAAGVLPDGSYSLRYKGKGNFKIKYHSQSRKSESLSSAGDETYDSASPTGSVFTRPSCSATPADTGLPSVQCSTLSLPTSDSNNSVTAGLHGAGSRTTQSSIPDAKL